MDKFLPVMAQICHYAGFNGIVRPMYGGLGLVLMFHRFTNEPDKRIDYSGVVSGAFLDRLVGCIRASGTEMIFLRDVPRAIAERRPFVCLTIDDGYRDNAEIALPVLRRYNAPVTIFVPSGILDRTMDSWWLQIEEIAMKQDNPREAYDAMIARASVSPEALELLRNSFIHDMTDLNERYFMSEAEIAVIDRDPLVEIGGHTVTHPFLKNLPEDDAYREILTNKHELQDLLGRPVEVFAYPFGNALACGAREYELARRAGYKVAVTTRDGNIFAAHENHLTALPRYSVRGQYENLFIFKMQRSGMYRALKSRFGPAFVTE